MTDNKLFYTSKEVGEMLGIVRQTVATMSRDGRLVPAGRIGANYIYTTEDIESCRRKYCNDGMSHTDISRAYGKSRTVVIYYFSERLKIKPVGIDVRRRSAKIYDPSTVKKAANILKWNPVTTPDQTNGQLPHDPA